MSVSVRFMGLRVGRYVPYDRRMSHWNLIEQAAADLGTKPDTIRKWRARGKVSHRCRLPIVQHLAGKGIMIDMAAFDAPALRNGQRKMAR